MPTTSATIYYVKFANGTFQAVACDRPPTITQAMVQGRPYRDLPGGGKVNFTTGDGDLLEETQITRNIPPAPDTAAIVTVPIPDNIQSGPDDVTHTGWRTWEYLEDFLTFKDSANNLCGEWPYPSDLTNVTGWSNYPPKTIPTEAPTVVQSTP